MLVVVSFTTCRWPVMVLLLLLMNLSNNTILLTGGATGIGLALAKRLRAAGSEVIICGRRADKLREAQAQVPGLHTYACDVADAADRAKLAKQVLTDFPALNVLINNAGIQNRFQLADLPTDLAAWEAQRQEIAINFDAPIHLAALLIPHLRQQREPAIINVTSGLAFAPMAGAPIYSATKARCIRSRCRYASSSLLRASGCSKLYRPESILTSVGQACTPGPFPSMILPIASWRAWPLVRKKLAMALPKPSGWPRGPKSTRGLS
jgi:hypothetical protein